MKKVVHLIYSLYVILVSILFFFLVSVTGIFLFKILPWEKAFNFLRVCMHFIFIFLFIKVKIEFEEELKTGQQYIFVANHISIFDVPLMGAFLPGFVNAIEADSHFKWPIYKHLIKGYQQIPINRNSIRESLKSFKIAEDRIKEQGRSIMVFPEGHRTSNGEIQEFKKLPFVMAQRAQVPVVPIGISGMWHLHENNGFFFKPTVLKIKFGKPFSIEDLKGHSANELNTMAYEKVKSLIEYK